MNFYWILTSVSSSRPGISSLHPSSSVRWKWNLFILYLAMMSSSFMIDLVFSMEIPGHIQMHASVGKPGIVLYFRCGYFFIFQ